MNLTEEDRGLCIYEVLRTEASHLLGRPIKYFELNAFRSLTNDMEKFRESRLYKEFASRDPARGHQNAEYLRELFKDASDGALNVLELFGLSSRAAILLDGKIPAISQMISYGKEQSPASMPGQPFHHVLTHLAEEVRKNQIVSRYLAGAAE